MEQVQLNFFNLETWCQQGFISKVKCTLFHHHWRENTSSGSLLPLKRPQYRMLPEIGSWSVTLLPSCQVAKWLPRGSHWNVRVSVRKWILIQPLSYRNQGAKSQFWDKFVAGQHWHQQHGDTKDCQWKFCCTFRHQWGGPRLFQEATGLGYGCQRFRLVQSSHFYGVLKLIL